MLSRAYSCASCYRAAKQCLKVSITVHCEARSKVLRWCAIWDRSGALTGEAGSLHNSALCRNTALGSMMLHSLLSQSWPYTRQSSAELFSGVFRGCVCSLEQCLLNESSCQEHCQSHPQPRDSSLLEASLALPPDQLYTNTALEACSKFLLT